MMMCHGIVLHLNLKDNIDLLHKQEQSKENTSPMESWDTLVMTIYWSLWEVKLLLLSQFQKVPTPPLIFLLFKEKLFSTKPPWRDLMRNYTRMRNCILPITKKEN